MRVLAGLFVIFLFFAGCSYYTQPDQEEARAHTTSGLRTGSGTIDSVGVLPRGRQDAPAATGGRAPDPNAYRLFIRMDSGGFQTVDTDNSTFMAGEAVEITPDGRVQHVSGTGLQVPRH